MLDGFNLSDFLPDRLAVLSERVSRRLAVEYGRTHGLSVAEWRVLVHLQRGGNVSVREIHSRVNLEKPRVSRAVSRLEAWGLVRKAQGTEDARLVVISLTGAAAAALGELLPEVVAIEHRLLEQIDPAELQTFYRVMEQLHATLDTDPEVRPRRQTDRDHARI